MLINSQPLDPKLYGGLEDENIKLSKPKERKITSQRIGEMFDGLIDDKKKPNLSLRLRWFWRTITDKYYDIKHSIRNHFKWHKTMCELRSWEGFDGLIRVMQTHLYDYITTEEKYGHSEENYKNSKIATAKEMVELIEIMKDPHGYSSRLRDAVDEKYPDYKYLISEYENGGTCFSGNFVAQGNGWVGMESGKDPRRGYFEFVDGIFELVDSPNQVKTDRLLAELDEYHREVYNAYEQAMIDSDKDFERLNLLLKENLYSWWD